MAARLLRALIFGAVLSLTLTNAYGQYPTPKYWNINPPGTPGNWSVAGNWNPGVVPDFHDWVFINNSGGDYVYLDNVAPVTVDSLTLGYSGSLFPPPSVLFGTGGQNLTVNNFLTIGQSGDLELQAGDVVNLAGINVAELTNYGRVHVGPGAQLHSADGSASTVFAGSSYVIEGGFTQQWFVQLSDIEGAVGGVPDGQLYLENGANWFIDGFQNGGTLTNSGELVVDKGTTLDVNGSVVNNGRLATGQTSGHNTLDIFGGLTNNGHFFVGSGDTANVNYLFNNMDVVVAQGGTLNLLNNVGIPDIPAGSDYEIYGTITADGQNAFWNLTTNEGNLILYNAQTTNTTPVGGTLMNSGSLIIGGGSTLNINGTLTNSGGYSALAVNDAGTVVSMGALNNMDDTEVTTGATLFLLNQPGGITTVAAGSVFLLSGEFYAGATTAAPNGFYQLTNVDGELLLENGLNINSAPIGGTLTVGGTGLLWVNSGTTFTLNGALTTAASSVFLVSDPGSVANVDTLTNNGFVGVRTGATLNLTNQAGGITDVKLGSTFDIAGDFIDAVNNDSAFAQLTDIHGTLTISNGRTIQDNPTGGTLTIHTGGVFNILNGTTFKVHSNVVGSANGTINLDPSSLIIEGTLYNNGANINVDGDSVFSVGSVVNGGPLMLTNNAGMTVNDGFYQLASGTLGESIDATGFSIVVVNGGPVLLDGTLDIQLDPNFNPAVGTFYRFLLFGPGELSGMFASIQNLYFNNGTEKWIVNYNNAGGYVELQAAPAPEPASMLLLGSGLFTLGYGARRRLRR